MNKNFGKVFSTLLLCLAVFPLWGEKCLAQTVSVKNNILYDATLTPNLGIEIKIDSLWSVGINAGLRPWPTSDNTTRKYKHFLIAPELRRWFSAAGKGHYVGADILYTHFNVGDIKMPFGLYKSVRHKRKQGDAVAIGPFYGYAWRLSPHWRLEAEAGFDIGYAWYNVYDCGHCGTKTGSDNDVFLMPRAGVNAVYTFGKK